MNEKKLIILFALVTLAIIGAGVFLISKTSSSGTISASYNVRMKIEEKNFDFGEASMNGGKINKTFMIKNEGTDTLKLTKIKTSCHCTQAVVKIQEAVSPSFGMNSVSSWIGEVVPGGEAQLEVIFDPAYHGEAGLGPVTRLVAVETNDPQNKRIEFSLNGKVVK